ncbi:MAG TPA: FMN-binding protein [Planctomycetota bacterium]|nr:FMN-binding protein [Planctomycetota bacterium]
MKLNVNSPTYVLCFTLVMASGFTAAITTLQVATAAKVRQNEALREEKALVSVFSLGDVATLSPTEIAATVRRRIERGLVVRDPETGRAFDLFRACRTEAEPGSSRNADDLEAVAFRFAGTGFWARITGLMALKPDLSQVTGLVFLDQAETPGLGGRIMEKEFQDRFQGLAATPPAAGAKFIYIGGGAPTGPSDPRSGRYVDAITGATQTSLAVGRFLDENLRQFHRAMAAAQ